RCRSCPTWQRYCRRVHRRNQRKIRTSRVRDFGRMPPARKSMPPGAREKISSLRKSLLVKSLVEEIRFTATLILPIGTISQIFGAIACLLRVEREASTRRKTIFSRTMLKMGRLLPLMILALTVSIAAQAPGDPVREAQRLTRVAQTAEAQNRYEDAIKAYETIAIIAKGSPRIAAAAMLNAGNIYMASGRFAQAANAYKQSLAFDPDSAEAQNNLGEALGELKQYKIALCAFQQAVALDGSYVKARYNMGVTYDRLGQMKYAEFVYRILIRDHPDFPLAYDS